MKFSTTISLLAAPSVILASPWGSGWGNAHHWGKNQNIPVSSSEPYKPCPHPVKNTLTHADVVHGWEAIWAGDESYIDKILAPDFELWQDRFPNGTASNTVPINNRDELRAFVQASRGKFESYQIVANPWFGVGDMVAMRWKLNAVWGGSDYAKLPKGSAFSYNGTDIALMDPCSGQVNQILSAQDSITFSHILGIPVGVV